MAIDLSIIIPCFDRLQLLKQTLRSVEAAIRHIHTEIILVDDGSIQPLADQLTEFAHLPLVIIRQENSGLTQSRWNGLLAAKGEYIQFLDSDDQVAAGKFDTQIRQMRLTGADVSHTDILHGRIDGRTNEFMVQSSSSAPDRKEPALFYIRVQPAPHSPVFKRAYITPIILKNFIPLSRDYDAIAEVWFYYNLSIYPAKIIKIDQPLTLYIHHEETRITNHWEWQALSAILLMNQFRMHIPEMPEEYVEAAKKQVAIAAFATYRGLPGNIDAGLQNAFIRIWESLGGRSIKELGGGRYFSLLSAMTGPVVAARFFKKLIHNDYRRTKTVSPSELRARLQSVLEKLTLSDFGKDQHA
jgi:glycosyltransferase involved in cell wall biosynthesis